MNIKMLISILTGGFKSGESVLTKGFGKNKIFKFAIEN